MPRRRSSATVADPPDALRAPTSRPPSPLRRLAALGALAVGALLALAAGDVEAGSDGWRVRPWRAAADTDTVAIELPAELDSLLFLPDGPAFGEAEDDTAQTETARVAAADTVGADSLARLYVRAPLRTGPAVSVVPRRVPGLRGRLGAYWRREVTLDTAAYRYRVREAVGDGDVRVPADLSLDEFLAARRRADLDETFRTLAARRQERTDRRGGLGFAVDIPGGDQGAFRTLFGKNEVALTVNGTSDLALGASYDQDELSSARTGRGGIVDPTFGQDLTLNVAGTIGDKLQVNVHYDTNSEFDFQNQVGLVYTGYEDDIVQRIEAGNVFLQTPSTLIRGGQRLFGLRTDFQFGPLALTAVASQQDAETVERVFEGGADARAFQLAPYDYEDDAHFFLGYAFHNWWDFGHREPGVARPPAGAPGGPGLSEVVGIEVWKHEPRLLTAVTEDVETTWAIALADLGEPAEVLAGGQEYLGEFDPSTGVHANYRAPLPAQASTLDRYDEADLARFRSDGAQITAETAVPGGLPTGAFVNNRFRLLRENVDYTIDPTYGTVSLTTALTDNEVLAVAYQYRTVTGGVATVGDYQRPAQTNSRTGDRTVLKLLRADRPTPTAPLWDLTLRNVYRVGGRALTPATFEFAVTFEPSGASASELPQDIPLGQRTFLQALGLDRLSGQGRPTPDNAFDFEPQLTVDADNGRVVFPVRQPFGDYLSNLLRYGWTVGGDRIADPLGTVPEAEALDRYVPAQPGTGATLYRLDRDNARRLLPTLTRFRLAGEFRSATQSIFNVGFSLVEGTVRVTSGGRELTEGADFRVNYPAGTVEVTNPLFLQDGQEFRVSVEQNQIVQIGSKTLVGLRADYRLEENAGFGATWMRLSERPFGDKFRIGEEALNNTVLGFDGAYLAEPRWLTRAVDALPLLQTRAPSRVELRGEVARLTPGHPTTLGFDRARDALRDAPNLDLDFAADELGGVSYVDDFEGSETATPLDGTAGWQLAAPPGTAGPAGTVRGDGQSDVTDPRLKANWRGLFAWYTITSSAYDEFGRRGLLTAATEEVTADRLYDREFINNEGDRTLPLLDLYFDPTRRGPYNYNGDLGGAFALNPRDAWGGFVRPLDAAYSDFGGQNNIEYVELLLRPVAGRDGTEPVGPGARLYLDLGRINEDVLPNSGALNAEDGLRDAPGPLTDDERDAWGRIPTGLTNGALDLFDETNRTEDLGLDGLPSDPLGGAYDFTEQDQFAPFLRTLPAGSAEEVRAVRDPSADDYHYFLEGIGDNAGDFFSDPAVFPDGATVQERYAHYLPSSELNSAVAQRQYLGRRGVAVDPDNEDVNGNAAVDLAEAYHRYEVPLDDAGLRASPFFLNTVTTEGDPQTWYLLRVPVRSETRVTEGLEREDFSRIEAVRVWTTGHDRPATVRIAQFELVGSQWLKSEQVGLTPDEVEAAPGPDPQLFIESVNNEENGPIYAIPRGTILNTNRSTTGAVQRTREQSLVFRAEGLAEGRRAAIVRSYVTRPLDLTKYSNLRAAVHGHGFERADSVRVFLRVGDNETEDYYEIEQPLYPFSPDRLADLPECPRPPAEPSNCVRSDSLWQTNVPLNGGRVDRNPINLVLAELNRVKLLRDRAGADPTVPFSLGERPEGAPAGARVTVVGQPSVQDVKVVVLGVRNGPGGQAVPLEAVTAWFNELRVTGYDEAGGASGFITANLALADVATVNARFSMTQDGFGELGGALGGRDFASQTAFTLQSSFAAHKLLPERFGWNVPVSLSIIENASTPRFDPDNGDVRLSELVAAAEEAPVGGPPPEGTLAVLTGDQILDRARTTTSSRNLRVQVTKTGSRSPWLRYTLDGLTASFNASSQTGANPSNQLSASDSWSGNLSYRVAPPRPLTVRPFWFAGGLPVLGGLRLNVLPQNVSLSADANRRTTATQARLAADFFGPDFVGEPDSVRAYRAPMRRTHLFDHGRQMDLRYVPFPFLQLGYASTTDQDFGGAGQRELDRVLVRRLDGSFARTYALPLADVRRDPGVLADLGVEAFPSDGSVEVLGGQRLDVLPLGSALQNVFAGGGRTRGYNQRLTASLRVSTGRLKWLSWIQPQALTYSADYSWRDQPVPSAPDLEVASASTTAQLQSSVRVVPRTFWRLFPFYRALETAQGAAGAPADSARAPFNPLRLARGLFLGLTGVDDVTLTYRGSLTATAGGLRGQSYSLLSGLAGTAPPLGYRLGLERALDIDRRIADGNAFTSFNDLLGEQHDLDARTTLRPLSGLTIGLSWRTTWQEAERLPFALDPNDPSALIRAAATRRGSGESTVFAFGGSYDAVVQRHADRYAEDVQAAGAAGDAIETEFISPTGLAEDFTAELARGLGAFGPNGLFQVPLPNWTVAYSGLERLPLVRRLAQQVTLQHGYSAVAQTDYATTTLDGAVRRDPISGLPLVGAAAAGGLDEPTRTEVAERFQPLVGLTVGWRGGLQTTLTYNKTQIHSLQPAQAQLFEKDVEDLRVDVSFAKTGLRLLGLRRLNNNLRFTLTAVAATDQTITRPFRQDIIDEITGAAKTAPGEILQRRLQLSPRVSYTISNQVTADLFVRYERVYNEGTQAPPYTSLDGGVNLRILFSN